MAKISLTVKGMHCKSCKILINDSLLEMGAKNIQIDLDEAKKVAKVNCEHADKSKVISVIEAEGYKAS